MERICIFDVIETLLDLRGLDPFFERVFGEAGAREQWFQRVLKTALTTTIAGPYRDFGQISLAALQMTAQLRGVDLTDSDRQELRSRVLQLPAHPDVQEGMQMLRDAGFRLVSLSNTPRDTSRAQLEAAGVAPYLELILSADDVSRLKPAREPYEYAARELGVTTADAWMIATHGWDLEGARHAGCRTVFLRRPGHVLSPLASPPDLAGDDLREVARRLSSQVA